MLKTNEELKELHGHAYASRFDETQLPSRLERLIANMNFTSQDNVVDFACGSGLLMEYIAPLVKSYVGVDFSQPFIDIANNKKKKIEDLAEGNFRAKNVRFECASIQDFCRRNPRSFEIAFAMDISEHVYDEEWLDMLTSMRAALVKGGKLYLHTPNARFFLEVMKKHNIFVKQFPEHIAVRTLEDNVTLLKKAGFAIAKTRLIPHYNVLRLLHPLSFMPILGACFQARIFVEAENRQAP